MNTDLFSLQFNNLFFFLDEHPVNSNNQQEIRVYSEDFELKNVIEIVKSSQKSAFQAINGLPFLYFDGKINEKRDLLTGKTELAESENKCLRIMNPDKSFEVTYDLASCNFIISSRNNQLFYEENMKLIHLEYYLDEIICVLHLVVGESIMKHEEFILYYNFKQSYNGVKKISENIVKSLDQLTTQNRHHYSLIYFDDYSPIAYQYLFRENSFIYCRKGAEIFKFSSNNSLVDSRSPYKLIYMMIIDSQVILLALKDDNLYFCKSFDEFMTGKGSEAPIYFIKDRKLAVAKTQTSSSELASPISKYLSFITVNETSYFIVVAPSQLADTSQIISEKSLYRSELARFTVPKSLTQKTVDALISDKRILENPDISLKDFLLSSSEKLANLQFFKGSVLTDKEAFMPRNMLISNHIGLFYDSYLARIVKLYYPTIVNANNFDKHDSSPFAFGKWTLPKSAGHSNSLNLAETINHSLSSRRKSRESGESSCIDIHEQLE